MRTVHVRVVVSAMLILRRRNNPGPELPPKSKVSVPPTEPRCDASTMGARKVRLYRGHPQKGNGGKNRGSLSARQCHSRSLQCRRAEPQLGAAAKASRTRQIPCPPRSHTAATGRQAVDSDSDVRGR